VGCSIGNESLWDESQYVQIPSRAAARATPLRTLRMLTRPTMPLRSCTDLMRMVSSFLCDYSGRTSPMPLPPLEGDHLYRHLGALGRTRGVLAKDLPSCHHTRPEVSPSVPQVREAQLVRNPSSTLVASLIKPGNMTSDLCSRSTGSSSKASKCRLTAKQADRKAMPTWTCTTSGRPSGLSGCWMTLNSWEGISLPS